MRRRFRHKGGFGHTGLRIDLQYDELSSATRTIVVTEVRAADPPASQCPVRPEGPLLNILVNILFKICRKHMNRTTPGIFGTVVVPASVGSFYLNDIIGFIADHRTGEFTSADIMFDQNLVAVSPVRAH